MGCGISKKSSASKIQAVISPRHRKDTLRQGGIVEIHDCAAEVQELLTSLSLEWAAAPLSGLGVASPAHILDLHMADFEEVGLTRVQVRQLQRAVVVEPVGQSPVWSAERPGGASSSRSPPNSIECCEDTSGSHRIRDIGTVQAIGLPALVPPNPPDNHRSSQDQACSSTSRVSSTASSPARKTSLKRKVTEQKSNSPLVMDFVPGQEIYSSSPRLGGEYPPDHGLPEAGLSNLHRKSSSRRFLEVDTRVRDATEVSVKEASSGLKPARRPSETSTDICLQQSHDSSIGIFASNVSEEQVGADADPRSSAKATLMVAGSSLLLGSPSVSDCTRLGSTASQVDTLVRDATEVSVKAASSRLEPARRPPETSTDICLRQSPDSSIGIFASNVAEERVSADADPRLSAKATLMVAGSSLLPTSPSVSDCMRLGSTASQETSFEFDVTLVESTQIQLVQDFSRAQPGEVHSESIPTVIEETILPSGAKAKPYPQRNDVFIEDIQFEQVRVLDYGELITEETFLPTDSPDRKVHEDSQCGDDALNSSRRISPGRGRASQQRHQPRQLNKELCAMLDSSSPSDKAICNQMPEFLRRRLDDRGLERQECRKAAAQKRAASLPDYQHGGGLSSGASSPRGVTRSGQRAVKKAVRSAPADGGRQMFDKNELRCKNISLFEEALVRYRSDKAPDAVDLAVCTIRPCTRPVRVYVRKRPLMEEERTKKQEFDVVSVLGGHPFPTKVVLHQCLLQKDLRTPFIKHTECEFDHAFGEDAQNNEVYRLTAFDLVLNARQGGSSTMFMFGQTGSGKTHTMTAIEEMCSEDLFEGAACAGDWISAQVVELRGNRCFDLLAPGPKGALPELRLRENSDGSFFAEGASTRQPSDPAELSRTLQEAQARRATCATEANSTSSRGHLLCTLRLLRSRGQLVLADCAGTERRKDSMYHCKERQQESAEINASLHALKECIRYASRGEPVPPHAVRSSSLTKLLANGFSNDDLSSQLAVICTVSPCSSDTEHSLATLRMGIALGGRDGEKEVKEVLDPFSCGEYRGRRWNRGRSGYAAQGCNKKDIIS